ncbi:M24 family metallopeptidase [Streptomyces sp. NPDC089919]|uniref:M24 family metallopeptidase n=1 Tax=Streptomyces sp. NPDC089919 TaxID=3155188 RepID=UPI003438C734
MAAPDRFDEQLRALALVEEERRAGAVFFEAVARGLVAPGRSEREVENLVSSLARELSGPRVRPPLPVVRSGPHTLLPPGREPAVDRLLDEDDVVVVALGADFARTLVLGGDPARRRLLDDLPAVYGAAREAYRADPALTGRHLHAELAARASKAGWTLADTPCAHLAGTADHPSPDTPLHRTTPDGWRARWTLTLHLTTPTADFAGTYTRPLNPTG